ncbi:SH3 domain-containing protein [Sporolactobacillus kofuensis]|uniref:SH3 domain-containing protein n=1 Tax=Sporolactobacillus kofuensis TaxID=269672 RepID=UPI002097BD53|nr:SH3 domain-containing protein [Sporolactobacillus kofuensis]MCO7176378.1 SH3 domain-containing protein [Sporolactobacillus kofuensis]
MSPNRNLTIIGTVAAAAAVAAVTGAPSHASADTFTPYKGQATANLNVRSTPSTDQQQIGMLKKNQTFDVIGIDKKSEKGNWLKIKYEGKTAYVDGYYVTHATTTTPHMPTLSVQSVGNYQAMTTENLNVRLLPSLKGTVLTTLKKGTTVTVTGKTTDGWLQIKYRDGSAYVSADFIKTAGTSSVNNSTVRATVYTGTTTDNLNVRQGSSTSTKVLTTLKKGSSVEVVGTSGSWLKIKYNGGTAYVSGSYVKKAGSSSTGMGSSNAPVLYTGTTTDNLNVRQGASTSTKVLTTLKKGSSVEVVGTSGSWLKIKYNGGTAYVSGSYVKKAGSSSTGTGSSNAPVLYTGTTTDNLNVRQGSSTSTKVLTTLKKGSSVEVVGTSGNWLKIKYNGGTAYVSESYVKKAGSSSTGTGSSNAPVLYTGTTTDNLNVRQGSSTAAKVLTTLKKGSSVEVVGTSGSWLKINYNGGTAYVSGSYVSKPGSEGTTDGNSDSSSGSSSETKKMGLITTGVNFRQGAGTSYQTYGVLNAGTLVEILADAPEGWVKVSYNGKDGYIYGQYVKDETTTTIKEGNAAYVTTKYPISFGQALAKEQKVNGSSSLAYYLNPKNFTKSSIEYYQFLQISSLANLSLNDVNAMLSGKGILSGQGAAFIQAAKDYKVNEVYLVSHALLETGNGVSILANGQNYNGVKVYNMFGIGAYDGSANKSGAAYAYKHGWTSPAKAIEGGAEWIAANYIYNSTYRQDTLYKMRWNPDALIMGSAAHQYATDVGWAVKQTQNFEKMYAILSKYNLVFDVPEYAN